jgi:hypothetical protein
MGIVCPVAIFLYSIVAYPEWLTDTEFVTGLVVPTLAVPVAALALTPELFRFHRESIQNEIYRRHLQQVTEDTRHALRPQLRGIPGAIPREETLRVLSQLNSGAPVLLTGDAGSGKSGIGIELTALAERQGIFCVLCDATKMVHYQDLPDLRRFFDLDESIFDIIVRISQTQGVLLVVDQLEVVSRPGAPDAVLRLLTHCAAMGSMFVVAISRSNTTPEEVALKPLRDASFRPLICGPLPRSTVMRTFADAGISKYSEDTVEHCRNILNLDIVCETARANNVGDVTGLQGEEALWRRYREGLHDREEANMPGSAGPFFHRAVELATISLRSADEAVAIQSHPSLIDQRLESSGVIAHLDRESRAYQFRHDRLRDYLYAWHACDQKMDYRQVREMIGDLHIKGVVGWMDQIYQEHDAGMHRQLLSEVLRG